MAKDSRTWNVYKFLEDGKLEVMASRRGITYFKPECNAILLFDGLTADVARDIEDSLVKLLGIDA